MGAPACWLPWGVGCGCRLRGAWCVRECCGPPRRVCGGRGPPSAGGRRSPPRDALNDALEEAFATFELLHHIYHFVPVTWHGQTRTLPPGRSMRSRGHDADEGRAGPRGPATSDRISRPPHRDLSRPSTIFPTPLLDDVLKYSQSVCMHCKRTTYGRKANLGKSVVPFAMAEAPGPLLRRSTWEKTRRLPKQPQPQLPSGPGRHRDRCMTR